MTTTHNYVPFLTPEEKDKFASYLEARATNSEQLLKQLEGLPAGGIMAEALKKELTAERIVAKVLRSLEETVI